MMLAPKGTPRAVVDGQPRGQRRDGDDEVKTGLPGSMMRWKSATRKHRDLHPQERRNGADREGAVRRSSDISGHVRVDHLYARHIAAPN